LFSFFLCIDEINDQTASGKSKLQNNRISFDVFELRYTKKNKKVIIEVVWVKMMDI